jgi:imidazolonepropionase-like amidohydrolase
LKISALLIMNSLNCFVSLAQNPMPGMAQSKPIALTNATIHDGLGKVIEKGTVVFDKGIITAIGNNIPANLNDLKVVDCTGKHIYPGLISASNALGLTEIESIAAVNDNEETGSLNPNVRALVAYNTDSDVIPTVRNNGVLITQATPEGGLISGQSSVFQLDGWNWEDAVLKKDDGIWLNWPEIMGREFSFETFSYLPKKNEARVQQLVDLHNLFAEALAYSQNKNLPKNLKLEAIIGLFDGSKVLYIRNDLAKEIIESVQFAKAHKISNIAIVGGEEAISVSSFLKENNVSVILSGVHELPAKADDDVDLPYKMPYLLNKAGVNTAISYSGKSWRTRNLPFLAGMAAGFGLNKEEALKMITSVPAQIMGIGNIVGSIAVGKQATLLVTDGDLLDMRTNAIKLAFIQGKAVDLEDKQKILHRKFSNAH